MILVTYQKRNGEILQRKRKTYTSDVIGDTTSMGWKVLDIKYSYNGKYYSLSEYNSKLAKAQKRTKRYIQIKQKFLLIYKHLAYSLLLIILLRLLENVAFYTYV